MKSVDTGVSDEAFKRNAPITARNYRKLASESVDRFEVDLLRMRKAGKNGRNAQ